MKAVVFTADLFSLQKSTLATPVLIRRRPLYIEKAGDGAFYWNEYEKQKSYENNYYMDTVDVYNIPSIHGKKAVDV